MNPYRIGTRVPGGDDLASYERRVCREGMDGRMAAYAIRVLGLYAVIVVGGMIGAIVFTETDVGIGFVLAWAAGWSVRWPLP